MNETVHRPWGTFTTIDEGNGYKVKKLFVQAGKRLSLQTHQHRDEYWVVVSGQGVFTIENTDTALLQEKLVSSGEQIKILRGQKHRIEAISDLFFVEVQLGICEESDIRRYEDDFGRF